MRVDLKFIIALLFAFSLSSGVISSKALAQDAKPPKAETAAPKVQVESRLERQVRNIASLLRCPVCQGESVYDSHSDVAVEMKTLIAEKITAGETTEQILTYFKDRYGNYILMEPPAEGLHWVIWIFPGFMALLGAMFLFQHLRSSTKAEHQRFEEQAKAKEGPGEIEELRL